MKAAVKAQLDKYETEGHIAPVIEPIDWISNSQAGQTENMLILTF